MDLALKQKLDGLHERLTELGSVVVAFSGGVDSTLVLQAAVAVLGPEGVVAVTGRSSSLASDELSDAGRLAALIGAEHVLIDTEEFENPDYLRNPVNRCYFCKTTLYAHLQRVRAERGFRAMINGINADDLGDYRPGLVAAREFEVLSPLADTGLTKEDVRALSAHYGLPTHDKPAAPCLSSRVPYGEAITPEKLRMIEAGERFLHELGMRECRVRHHEKASQGKMEALARIEIPPTDFARLAEPEVAMQVDAHFRGLGYRHVTLDLRGFRSGSLNELITIGVATAPACDDGAIG